MSIDAIKRELKKESNKKDIKILQRFFKTGKGEYGEGDIFIGVRVPKQRKIAKKYVDIKLNEIEKLLKEKIHEYRLTALLILVEKYNEGNESKNKKLNKEKIYNLYLKNLKYINNWDLVDLSAHKIIGKHIYDNNLNDKILFKLSENNNLWFRRIAIISSFYFIKQKKYNLTFKLAEKLLEDKEDLIHKAVGWMLREIGKSCGVEKEEIFLKKYYKKMPRTMLRYSIERFPKNKKEFYMKK